jgi:hypothetical protein
VTQDYIASSEEVKNEGWIGNGLDGAFPAFTLTEENHKETSFKLADLLAENWTRDLPNTKER